MVANKPKARRLDFTDVKERSEWNPRLVEEGDYEGKILSVVEQKSKVKDDGSGGEDMWVFGFGLKDMPSARYPYYCVLNSDNLWKIRNIASACGKSVGGRKLSVDPSIFVGKEVALSMETEAGTGNYKDKSVVGNIFKLSDLLGDTDDDDQSDDDDDADDEPAPPVTKRRTRKPAAVVEDDDDEDDEPEPPKRTRRKAAVVEPEDDEDDEDEEEPEPPKRVSRRRKPAPKPVEDEDEDDEEEDEEPPARTPRRRAAAKPAAAKTTAASRRRKPPVEDDDDMEIEEL